MKCLACGKTIPPDPRYYWRRYCPPEKPGQRSKCQNRHSARVWYKTKGAKLRKAARQKS